MSFRKYGGIKYSSKLNFVHSTLSSFDNTQFTNYIGENNITIDKFKDIITGFINSSNYIEKTKKSVIEFIGFKWREIEIKELKNLIIENAVMGNIVIEQKPKGKTKIKTKFSFSKEEDRKILKDYEDNNNDIMIISTMNNILPWQVVSLLMQYLSLIHI